jgi:hypothetical protein
VILELGAISLWVVEEIRRARRSRFSVLACGVPQHPADMDEVVGNDSETHPAMPARVTFLETTARSFASLEQAEPLTADAPFLSLAEPAPLVALSTRRTWGTPEGYATGATPRFCAAVSLTAEKIRRHRPPHAGPRRAAADAVRWPGGAASSPRAVGHTPVGDEALVFPPPGLGSLGRTGWSGPVFLGG